MATKVLHPTVLWAERKDKLFVTIDVQDCKDPQIKVTNDKDSKCGKIHFEGKAHSHATGPDEHGYVLDLELAGEVDGDDVRVATTDRTVTLVIAKAAEGPYWERLLKKGVKQPQYIKVDWDKWVDEDEEDALDMDMSSMQQLQQMQQMQAMSGAMGGMGMPSGMEGLMGGMGGGGFPPGMAGMDFSQFAGMAGGEGGDEEEDDDDDDLPPLEPLRND